ncbi:hypothetical protein OPS25_15790 [Alteromonas ponticola]|uniref:EF-hand domain-containing protein n=1 Tax=Alteromonas aquimaris TaxID=2998417 RepID=A0ABT3PB35_9ALTE|nr:hypothetical protein [Alteromonas aquimaris]MCW8109968.1 hypothetical protein [Alteromonas aquimaris]
MKKLTLAVLISSALSAGAVAGDWKKDKMESADKDQIESTFAELDNDENGFISKEEADDDDIWEHFAKIDTDSDDQLSQAEFDTHLQSMPQHYEDDITATAQSGAIGDIDQEDTVSTETYVDADLESDDIERDYDGDSTTTVQTDAEADLESDDIEREYDTDTTVVAQTERDDAEVVITEQGQDSDLTAKSEVEVDAEAQNNEELETNSEMTARTESDVDLQEQDPMVQQDSEVKTESEMNSEDMVANNEFDMMDTDHDGQLSKAEAAQSGVNESFEDIDEDNDQLITRMEYAEYRQNRLNDYDEDEE